MNGERAVGKERVWKSGKERAMEWKEKKGNGTNGSVREGKERKVKARVATH